jgi:hypothetical protein
MRQKTERHQDAAQRARIQTSGAGIHHPVAGKANHELTFKPDQLGGADQLDPLMIDTPAFNAEELSNLAVPVPSVLFGKPDQGKTQLLVLLVFCSVAQSTPGHPKDPAGPPLPVPSFWRA